jgi:hypothetical protein
LIAFRCFAGAAVITGLLFLAGCAAPRTADADVAIHKVVIVTAMSEAGLVNKIGLTIFSNDATTIPQDGALSKTAVDTMTRRLNSARPNWEIVPAGVDLVALGAKYKNGIAPSELGEILKRTGADAVFVVSDIYQDTPARGSGVGAALRKLPGIDPHVIVRAHVVVDMLDKSGERIAGAPGGETPLIKAGDFGLTDDIASVNAPEARARLSQAMRAELARDLDGALLRMGY